MRNKSLQQSFLAARRSMPVVVGLALLIFAASYATAHLSAPRRQCPAISCESSQFSDNPVTFSVSPAPPGARYQWTVTPGTIESGQGTPNITVGNVAVGQTVRASVVITGAGNACPAPAPCMTAIIYTPAACSAVDVEGPETVKKGELAKFTTNISGGDPNVTPTFNWTISAGTITSGQGTSFITVDTSGVPAGTPITATVDVGGFDRSCATSDSVTTIVRPSARKISEFGAVGFGQEKSSVDKLAAALEAAPESEGYVVVHFGNDDESVYAQGRADGIRDYLVRHRKFDAARIKTQVGKSSAAPKVELWLVPAGASPREIPGAP